MTNLQIIPGSVSVEPQHVEMMVPLYSYGCGKKIKKALSHFRGIYSVTVDYKLQKVTVWGICNRYDVLATIRRKRREARFWDIDHDLLLGHRQPDFPSSPPPAATYTTVMSVVPHKLRSLSLHWKTWKNHKADLLRSYRRKH